jgi:hypothetical protein
MGLGFALMAEAGVVGSAYGIPKMRRIVSQARTEFFLKFKLLSH